MNISELLARNARKFPNKEGFITLNGRYSYREVDEKVNQLANALQDQGISRGDKVILFSPNTIEFVYSYFAVQRIGAIIVPINAKLSTEEIRYILEHSEAIAFIGDELVWPQVTPLVEKYPILWITTGSPSHPNVEILNDFFERGSKKPVVSTAKEDDLSTMLYTSGSTGKPKGVLLSQRNILSVAIMMCIETEMNEDSRILHMMPLSHSAPLHLFFVAGTYVGATHVLAPTFTPSLLLELVASEKITHFFGAPVAYLLAAKQPEIEKVDLSSMKRWVYGGAPLSPTEVQLIQEKFKTNALMCVYGLTEAGPNGTYLSPKDHAIKAGSIGKRAALNCEIRIVNEEGNDIQPGEVGEIILYGEGNMAGYYKDEEKTKETMKNGWLYTGDMATYDEDGYIWIVDRKKDMIISGGVNIYPKEIEDTLKTHPDIEDVAVVGVPHPDWGETVKAYIVTSKKIENLEEMCKQFLEGKLANFKIPKLYEQIDELPRNTTGKILKYQLRKKEYAK
ncbi:class I adenylate-forming enzyme family protein [Fervidibacillus albus]|uniref:Long-chain-fatty-acid--CoA ligase n=1 Tax=Fervidibacillus albus TaxID=2980026 RepID=A0A9E8LT77_9BACI|nr:long-chain-fatty-acid--CoA ligase [Fervidibacillus albus]WAA09177.1 long-chain-fatty-acid--CoA ligase [Fervidibacillus albus]